MGVKHLWEILDSSSQILLDHELEQLRGKRVAVDISLWLVSAERAGYFSASNTEELTLQMIFSRILKLLSHGIKPVFIFDGEKPALKLRTLEDRRRLSEKLEQQRATKTAFNILQKRISSQISIKGALREIMYIEYSSDEEDDEHDLEDPEDKTSTTQTKSNTVLHVASRGTGGQTKKNNELATPVKQFKGEKTGEMPSTHNSSDFSQNQLANLLASAKKSQIARQSAQETDEIVKPVVSEANLEIFIRDKRSPRKPSTTLSALLASPALQSVHSSSHLEASPFLSQASSREDALAFHFNNSSLSAKGDTFGTPPDSPRAVDYSPRAVDYSPRAVDYSPQPFVLDSPISTTTERKSGLVLFDPKMTHEPLILDNSSVEVSPAKNTLGNGLRNSSLRWTPRGLKTAIETPELNFSDSSQMSIPRAEGSLVRSQLFGSPSSSQVSLPSTPMASQLFKAGSKGGVIDLEGDDLLGGDPDDDPLFLPPERKKSSNTSDNMFFSKTYSFSSDEEESDLHIERREMQGEATVDFFDIELEIQRNAKKLATSNTTERHRPLKAVYDQTTEDCKKMFRGFGLPFIEAPSEAEAQCAELFQLGLVDAIFTDDSDIFLFGGDNVYRNVFSSKREMTFYQMSQIHQNTGLDRQAMIDYAHLVGSDYTVGLEQVGKIKAMQILAFFSPWAHKKPDRAADRLENFRKFVSNEQTDLAHPKNSFYTSLRRNSPKLPYPFPSPPLRKAYLQPRVDSDPTELVWGDVDTGALTLFCQQKLGMPVAKTQNLIEESLQLSARNQSLFLPKPQNLQTRRKPASKNLELAQKILVSKKMLH